VGVEFGRVFKITDAVRWSWEMSLNYQDLYQGFNNNEGRTGKWVFARLGVKASLSPRARSHWTFRGGLAWGRATEDPGRNLDIGTFDAPGRGDYYGGYVGLGYEWDLFDCCITTGPEVQLFAGVRPSGSGWAIAPSLMWHVLFNM
jgi:hypothetical protein